MEVIQVREYARLKLHQSRDENISLDEAWISNGTYIFLAELIENNKLFGAIYRDHIRLDSQVGYIETPNGIGIEILPKISTKIQEDQIDVLRAILQKMVTVLLEISSKEITNAHLVKNNQPIHEWIYQQFLNELKTLFRKGLKKDYERVNRTEKFMRGRLNINQMMNRGAGKDHIFPIDYDEFNFHRIENRLLKTALSFLFKKTKGNDNWRVANELMQRVLELAPVNNGHLELKKWQKGKIMQDYRAIFPWCELILEKMNPDFQKDQHRGIALLFPMEKLFEAYVGHYLQKNIDQYDVKTQEQKHYLVKHQDNSLFQLKPDFVLRSKNSKDVIIADTKWKNIVQDKSLHNYGISQADIYQMLAYGYKYQQNDESCTEMILIYPYHDQFTERLSVFEFHSKNLNLHVVPFKLWNCEKGEEGQQLAEFLSKNELKCSN